MKLLLFLVLFGQIMDFEKFETFIGKDIAIANNVLLDEGFESKNLLGINFYTSDSYRDFYNMPYNMISIMTDDDDDDDDDIIKSITIHFHQVIDSNFYNSFIVNYGKPKTIQVVDNPEFIGEWVKGEYNSRARKSILNMREGTFEENPLFMLWNDLDFIGIKAFLRHEQNISEITFRVPTEGF